MQEEMEFQRVQETFPDSRARKGGGTFKPRALQPQCSLCSLPALSEQVDKGRAAEKMERKKAQRRVWGGGCGLAPQRATGTTHALLEIKTRLMSPVALTAPARFQYLPAALALPSVEDPGWNSTNSFGHLARPLQLSSCR